MEHHEVVVERSIEVFGYRKHIYLIDMLNNNILLHKRFNINKKTKGFINKNLQDFNIKIEDLIKFITFDIECITDLDLLQIDGDYTYFDPVLIAAHDFYNDVVHTEILRHELGKKDPISLFDRGKDNESRKDYKIELLSNFFYRFMQPKYHKFILYAHNLLKFDGIFILESLINISDNSNVIIQPLMRDNKLISIKNKIW
jgi:hypothetical protein